MQGPWGGILADFDFVFKCLFLLRQFTYHTIHPFKVKFHSL